MKKQTKINVLIFIVILAVVILCNIGLLGKHYASDTYNLMELGFEEYAIKWFLPAGRFIAAVALFLCGKVCATYWQYIITMQIIAVFLASISIYLFYKMIIKIDKNPTNSARKVLILLVSVITIINHGSYQYFYYAESGIMWLSVLFTILAIRQIALNKKNKYIKSFIYLLIAVNCYQASVLFFIPAIVLLIFYKNEYEIKKSLKEIIINVLLLAICMIINYLLLIMVQNVFNLSVYRETNVIKIDIILLAKKFTQICYLFNDGFPMFIKTAYIVIFMFLIQMLPNKYFKNDKLKTYLILILMIISSIIPPLLITGLLNFYIGDRILYSYTSIIGFCYIFLLLYLKMNNIKTNTKIFIYGSLIAILVITIINFWDLSSQHLIVNKKDEQLANYIGKMIDEYETNTKNRIEKIIYCYDSKYEYCYVDVRHTWELTARTVGANWCFENVISYFTGKKLEKIKDENIYETVFDCQNWNYFSEEQIKFKDNIMYYCIY